MVVFFPLIHATHKISIAFILMHETYALFIYLSSFMWFQIKKGSRKCTHPRQNNTTLAQQIDFMTCVELEKNLNEIAAVGGSLPSIAIYLNAH